MKNKDFCHLHVHTEYSQLDGMGSVDEYAQRASKMGFKYLACTDHGNIDGLIRFQKACADNGITPILGAELYIVPENTKDKKRGHILCLVKNATGFKNLCKLITASNTQFFYYKPRVTYDYLLENCEGLVISTACLLSFVRMFPDGTSLLRKLHNKIGNDLYCEIMPHKLEKQKNLNRKVIRLANKMNLKVIATMDSHYPRKFDYKAQDVLLAIQRKTTMDDKKRFRFTITDLYLKSANEMRKSFKKIGQFKPKYLTNTIEVAEKCSGFTIPKKDIDLPRVPGVPVNPSKARRFLLEICWDRYEKIFGEKITETEYNDRLKEEYRLIVKKKFQRYFFMVWEVVNWCKENGIMVGPGRGSVGGSLMAYLMGITSVDPIKHNLLFSRFINEDRIDYPDIDIDFEHTKRHLVRQHLETIYGEDNVAGVSSFNRMKAKAVITDVGRAFGVHWQETKAFTKLIEDNDEHTGIEDAIDSYEECEAYARKYPKVIKFAKRLEGQVRGYGQHAAALVISKEKIAAAGRCALRVQDESFIVNWEKNDTEYVGLMKLDALGLKLLSVLSETTKLIEKNSNKKINLENLPLNDKKVLKDISNGKTVGVFQLGTYAMTALISEMGIEQFDHIAAAVALVRPGPANSGMTAEYIKRKNGANWKPMHKKYEEITKETYGLLVYQEQVMQVISTMAGLPYNISDKIRKIIGKKRSVKEFEKYKRMFVKGCSKTKYFSRREALKFWVALQEWAKYGFNKSHSVEYAILAYWCSYLKRYHPTEFICASLTYGSDGKKKELIEEAYKLGLSILLPKVGVSASHQWVAREGKLFIPFIEVKGIGDTKATQCSIGTTEKKGNIVEFVQKEKRETKIGGKLGELLDLIGSYDQNNPPMNDEIKALFDFRVVVNPRQEYKKLYDVYHDRLRLDRLDAALEGDPAMLKEAKQNGKQIVRARYKPNKKLSSCELCDLIDECRGPVPPSTGKYNIMITGEAPGPEEDKQRQGFVGRSGDKVWNYLKKKGFKRELFHVSNIGKCYPSKSRKPSSEQIKLCAEKYLTKEIDQVKPIIILGYGNTSLEFFYGQKSGITDMSGKCLWNERFGTWVVYCMHPAATLHNPDNKIYFDAGMKRFCKVLNLLGLPKS